MLPVLEWATNEGLVSNNLFWRAMRVHRPPILMADVCTDAEKYLMKHSRVTMSDPSFVHARERVEATLVNTSDLKR
eukprot:2473375-Amphidinium_carterae.1